MKAIKTINKILISILIMSILITAVVTSAKDTDNTVSVSTNTSENIVNLGDMPVAEIEEAKLPTSAEEKARFENRKKLGIEKIASIEDAKNKKSKPQITSSTPAAIPIDVSYTNPQSSISTFATSFSAIFYDSDYVNWKTYSFYLPVASNVYTDVNGNIGDYYSDSDTELYVDSDALSGIWENAPCDDPTGYCYSDLKRSRLTYLPKGWHNIYLDGHSHPTNTDYGYTVSGFISIIAIPEYTAIIVTSPNGYENWYRGQTRSITWSKYGQPGANVKIELYKAGVLSTVISSLTPNDGTYSWYIPTYLPIGTDYKIKISSTVDSKYNDWSNNNFKIS